MTAINVSTFFVIPMLLFTGCGTTKVYKESTTVSRPYHAPVPGSGTKERYVNAVNKVRSEGRRCGREGYFAPASALRWSDALYKASYEHSNDMAKSNSFSHIGSSKSHDWTAKVQQLKRGSSFKERIENNGYRRWKNIAENIASGAVTIEETMVQWLRSDRHCANIMNPEFTDVGMARVKKDGTQQIYYWTQNFGARL